MVYLRDHPLFAEKADSIDRENAAQLANKLLISGILLTLANGTVSDEIIDGSNHFRDSSSALYLVADDAIRASHAAGLAVN
jgi:hypothetical protein